jgi:tetratricopeptide (TPR) repeat protein
MEQRRYDVAEGHLRGALDMMPYLRLARYSLAQVQALQGKRQEAQQSLDEGQRYFPDREYERSIRQFLQ